ncbi:MAG: putative sigma-54 modulation protein [Chthoniobacter sp.]|jgi:putative sigma-54 modulation protein|nr:putative sigma-54 modulation protein [Chthoniobacter sp.]
MFIPFAREVATRRGRDKQEGVQIHLSPRHLQLTAAIHQHAAEKVLHLEEFADDIVAAHVVLMHDENAKPADRYTVKLHLAVPGPDLHAEESHSDLYAALDLVTAKLAGQLRKRKAKFGERRHKVQKAEEKRRRGLA